MRIKLGGGPCSSQSLRCISSTSPPSNRSSRVVDASFLSGDRYAIFLFPLSFNLLIEESTWQPPGISILLARPNKLKACLVAGAKPTAFSGINVPSHIWILLFDHYKPCSHDMRDVIRYTSWIRKKCRLHCRIAVVRPWFSNNRSSGEQFAAPSPLDLQEIKASFASNREQIAAFDHRPAAFTSCRLVLPPDDAIPASYMAKLVIDILTWQDLANVYCCVQCAKEVTTFPEMLDVGRSMLSVVDADETQTVAIGKAVRVP